MATIQLNSDDLRTLIRESVARLLESEDWYDSIPLCRLPYFVSIQFSDHAIEREYERDITEDDVIGDARSVIRDIIRDFKAGLIRHDTRVRIVNRETCVVSIVAVKLNPGGKAVRKVLVTTSYIWDGRYNLDGIRNYYTGEYESRAWREAEEWNRENQDKVKAFTDWKRGRDVADQRRKAENEYYWRNHPGEPSRERRMSKLNAAFDRLEKKGRHEIDDALPEGDLDAIRDYFKYFDRRQLSSTDSVNKELWADDYRKKTEADMLREFVRKAARQALSEAFRESMSKNPFATRKAGKNGFYA